MTAYDLAVYAAVALLVVAILIVPKMVSFRRRLVVGTLFFIAGWAGIPRTLAALTSAFHPFRTLASLLLRLLVQHFFRLVELVVLFGGGGRGPLLAATG